MEKVLIQFRTNVKGRGEKPGDVSEVNKDFADKLIAAGKAIPVPETEGSVASKKKQ